MIRRQINRRCLFRSGRPCSGPSKFESVRRVNGVAKLDGHVRIHERLSLSRVAVIGFGAWSFSDVHEVYHLRGLSLARGLDLLARLLLLQQLFECRMEPAWNSQASRTLEGAEAMRQFGPPVMRKSEKKNGSKTPILLKPAAKPAPRTANKLFTEIAKITSHEVGKPWVFAIAFGTVVVWALPGPYFNYSDTWQLVINTGTTIVTFLMVFLIQNSQNRDPAAIQVKLDELIRVSKANNSLGLEHLTDEELEEVQGRCREHAQAVLAARAVKETNR